MHAQTKVVGSQGVWERSGQHSPRAHVQHQVVHSWEAGHTVGKGACSGPAQNKDRLYFPTLPINDLACPRPHNLLDSLQMGELDLPQRRHL